jgi:proteic killer suppression protein
VIKNFKDKETAKIFNRERSRKLPSEIQQTALRKLRMLNRVYNLDELKIPPGNRLECLQGDRQGQYSIRINSQWRICFEWQDGHSLNVEIVDYH